MHAGTLREGAILWHDIRAIIIRAQTPDSSVTTNTAADVHASTVGPQAPPHLLGAQKLRLDSQPDFHCCQ